MGQRHKPPAQPMLKEEGGSEPQLQVTSPTPKTQIKHQRRSFQIKYCYILGFANGDQRKKNDNFVNKQTKANLIKCLYKLL